MKTAFILIAAGLAAARVSAAEVDWSKLPPAATNTGVTFEKDIAPMLNASCVRCHGANRQSAHLRLDSLDAVLKGTEDGPILTAGDSASSLIVKAVSQLDPKLAMPPKPRGPRGPRPMGTNAPAMHSPDGGPGAGGPPPGGDQGPGGPPPGGPGGPPPDGIGGPPSTNGPGMHMRPMAKPLTAEQVGLLRAWIDQGAK
jgi:hypothetical protein